MRRRSRGWLLSATTDPEVHTAHAPGPAPLREDRDPVPPKNHPLGFAPSTPVERDPLLWEGDQA